MSGKIKAERIPDWYDPYVLKSWLFLKCRGSYGEYASELLHVKKESAEKKINRCNLTHEDTIEIAKGLHLTLHEYATVFLKDVFKEDTPE